MSVSAWQSGVNRKRSDRCRHRRGIEQRELRRVRISRTRDSALLIII